MIAVTIDSPAAGHDRALERPFHADRCVRSWMSLGIIHPDDWSILPREKMALLESADSPAELLSRLIEMGLLARYQADCIQRGSLRGLILGNYRVLERRAGEPGSVFTAEHLHMRHKVAIKVLPVNTEHEPDLLERILRKLRSVLQLDHPNIVGILDAGLAPSTEDAEPDLAYFVMEYIQGHDLAELVEQRRLSLPEACGLIFQAASALDEAHRQGLVHGSVKPSNLLVTVNNEAKLLDFGLARRPSGAALTASHDRTRTLDFLAPEQIRDDAPIDIRVDVFGLGATLFYSLAGEVPFALPDDNREIRDPVHLLKPRDIRALRDDLPEEFVSVLERMLAFDPAERYPTPQAVMHALVPFLHSPATVPNPRCARNGNDGHGAVSHRGDGFAAATGQSRAAQQARVLLVENEQALRRQMLRPLVNTGLTCLEANGPDQAADILKNGGVAVVLLGVDHPDIDAAEILKGLRSHSVCANLRIIAASAKKTPAQLAAWLANGADDCVRLPLSDVQLVARVQAAIRHKTACDQMDRLNQQLLDLNNELERSVSAQNADLAQTRNALVLALARLVEYRSLETVSHLLRMQRYCVELCQAAASNPRLAPQITREFIQTLECVAPLHDLGNVGLPDAILLKTGRLEPDELEQMKMHTLVGADILQQVAYQFGSSVEFLQMAIDVARHHHEHCDGTGYPDGLVGDAIPLAARIVALADGYDSLRSRRAQRPRLSHTTAVQIILETTPGKYDPDLLEAFRERSAQFDRIYSSVQDDLALA